jgi:predicted transcriptional regulator
MRKGGRDIPAAELEVLAVLWRLGKGTVRDVQAALGAGGRRLAYTTVLTLLGRLEERGCARALRESPAHIYEPLVSRDAVAADRLGALVEQVGEGRAMPLILRLVETGDLTRGDIKELRRLLARLEAEEEKRGEK